MLVVVVRICCIIVMFLSVPATGSPFKRQHRKQYQTKMIAGVASSNESKMVGYNVLPAPFPAFNEQFIPAPPSEMSKLVYLSYPRKESIILFTQGLNRSDIKFCIQGNFKSRKLGTKVLRVTGDCCVIVVECAWNRFWVDGRAVSVGKHRRHSFPSTARLHTELMSIVRGPKYSICAMTQVRDASKFLPDWIDYHRRIGIDHFYVFDNNSSESFVDDPDTEIIRFPWKKSQYQALMYGIQVVKARCQWLAVFDVDEFIYPRGVGSIPALIASMTADRSDAGEMRFNMLKMSSNNLDNCPNTSVPEGYAYRMRRAVPDFINPKGISWVASLYAHNIHWARFEKGHSGSRTGKVIVPSEMAYMVHYSVQCWPDYFVAKYKYGRNGLVSDYANPGYRQDAAPRGWRQRMSGAYSVKDTSFRGFFLRAMARPRPEPVLVF